MVFAIAFSDEGGENIMDRLPAWLAYIGWGSFFIGIGLFLLDLFSFLDFLVPVLTIGGVCLLVVSTFLSFDDHNKSR